MKEVTIYTEYDKIPPAQVVFSIKHMCNVLSYLPRYSKVAIVMDKTPTFVASIIACLNSKITFSPFDPKAPRKRTNQLLQEFEPDLILTDIFEFKSEFKVHVPKIDYQDQKHTGSALLKLEEDPIHTAYVIFTSGSTGKPKGVEVGINSLKNYLTDSAKRYAFNPSSNIGCLSAVNFDLAYTALLLPFVKGGALSLYNSGNYAKVFKEIIQQKRITHLKITPGHSQILNEFLIQDSALQTLIIGGEQLLSEHINNLISFCDVYNEYGPTEATIGCSTHLATKTDNGEISIGKPINGVEYKTIANSKGELELLIGGNCLAKGYWKDPNLTEKAFLTINHKRWYKTGDIVEYKNDQLFFVARLDDVQKIKGYRVNPLETTQLLLELKEVENAYSFLNPKRKQLQTFLVSSLSKEEIFAYLKENLPSYSLPSEVFFLKKIPLTPNGKTDQKKLLELSSEQSDSLNNLKEIWTHLLNQSKIEEKDNFFVLGGSSLLALQCIQLIESELNTSISPLQFYQNSTFSALSTLIEEKQDSAVKFEWLNTTSFTPTQTQVGIATWQSIHQNNIAYNEISLFEIEHTIDKNQIEKAIQSIILTNDVYHIQFNDTYQLVQQEFDVLEPIDSLVAESIEEAITNFNTPFTQNQFLFKFKIIFALGKRYLAGIFHHVVTDYQSQNTFFHQLEGNLLEQTVEANRYTWKNYSHSINHFVQQNIKEDNCWKEIFSETSTSNYISSHIPYQELSNQKTISMEMDGRKKDEIQNILQHHNLTIPNYLHFVFNFLLSKYFNQNHIAHAFPVSTRDQAIQESLQGPQLNTLPFAFENKEELSLLENLKAFANQTWAAISEKNTPVQSILESTNLPTMQKALDVIFVVQENYDSFKTIKPKNISKTKAKSLLQLEVILKKNGIQFNFDFEEICFPKAERSALKNLFFNGVQSLVKHLDVPIQKISWMDSESKSQRISANQTTKENDSNQHTIIDQLENRCNLFPNSPAITNSYISLTNQEVDQYTNAIATILKNASGNIGVVMNRGIHQVLSVLGILKAGLTYVPISPDFPQKHIQNLIDSAEIEFVLFEKDNPTPIPGKKIDISVLSKTEESINLSSLEQSAYIIYTSGTTGNPKGVEVQHKALMNRLLWGADVLTQSKERILHKTPVTFDVSISEIFGWIIGHHELVILDHLDEKNPEKVSQILIEEKIDLVHFVPGMLNLFLSNQEQENHQFPDLKRVTCSGETLSHSTVVWFKKLNPNIQLWNLYGPTETTVEVSFKECFSHEQTNLGYPIHNSSIYILDQNLNELPIGIQGDLYIAGENLAKGYYNNLALTQKSFIELTIDNKTQRIYNSGDRALRLENGEIQFIGRVDDQLKINGVRIEIKSIKEVLHEILPLNGFEVFARQISQSKQLICAITKRALNSVKIEQIKEHILNKLPAYYCPEVFIEIENIPFTKSGKIDRKKLEELTIKEGVSKFKSELTDRQKTILKIVRNNLLQPNLDVNDDYFEQGGNSFNLLSLASDIETITGETLNINSIFKHSQVSTLLAKKSYKKEQNKITVFGKENSEPIFCFPPAAGYGLIYQQLANNNPDKKFICFDYYNTKTLLDYYIKEIKSSASKPPILIGYSGGGNIAFSIAKRLQKEGISTHKIILIDSYLRKQQLQKLSPVLEDLKEKLIRDVCSRFENLDTNQVQQNINDYYNFFWLNNMESGQVDCDIIHIISDQNNLADITHLTEEFISNNWNKLTSKSYTCIEGKGDHKNMLYPPFVEYNSKLITNYLTSIKQK